MVADVCMLIYYDFVNEHAYSGSVKLPVQLRGVFEFFRTVGFVVIPLRVRFPDDFLF